MKIFLYILETIFLWVFFVVVLAMRELIPAEHDVLIRVSLILSINNTVIGAYNIWNTWEWECKFPKHKEISPIYQFGFERGFDAGKIEGHREGWQDCLKYISLKNDSKPTEGGAKQ